MPAGVILAGGRSTRFGEADKALEPLAGKPMLCWVGERIAPVTDELIINCRADQRAAIADAVDSVGLQPTFAIDKTPDLGPVAGIKHGLEAATTPYAFVIACDMPLVDPALVSLLADHVVGHDAAVPRLSDGWLQTTQAVYHTEAMAVACEHVLESDTHRVLDALERIDYLEVSASALESISLESFENVNTREEFEAAAARLQ